MKIIHFTEHGTSPKLLKFTPRTDGSEFLFEKQKFSNPLTYPCLRAVHRQLDPNLRIALAQRCPSLQKIEKSTPLRINTLSFGTYGLKINSHTYHLQRINIGKPENTFIQLERDATLIYGLRDTKHLPVLKCATCSRDYREALIYLYEKVLGNRNLPVKVNRMEFKNYFSRQVWDLRNVKLRIKKLEVHNEIKQVLSTLAPCLDESSYPLESLELVQQFFTSDDLFNHHIIQTAKDLRIIGIHGNFHRLPNLRVHIQKVNVSPATLIKAIDYWLTRGKEIGTHFSISSCEMLEEEARVLWKAIRTNYIDLVEENQRLIDFSPEPLKIKSRFFSELWFNVVKESGNTWICDLQVRKTRA